MSYENSANNLVPVNGSFVKKVNSENASREQSLAGRMNNIVMETLQQGGALPSSELGDPLNKEIAAKVANAVSATLQHQNGMVNEQEYELGMRSMVSEINMRNEYAAEQQEKETGIWPEPKTLNLDTSKKIINDALAQAKHEQLARGQEAGTSISM